MDGVLDFLVLESVFKACAERTYQAGDRSKPTPQALHTGGAMLPASLSLQVLQPDRWQLLVGNCVGPGGLQRTAATEHVAVLPSPLG